MISVNALYAPPERHCQITYKQNCVDFFASPDQVKELRQKLIATGVVEFYSQPSKYAITSSPSELDIHEGITCTRPPNLHKHNLYCIVCLVIVEAQTQADANSKVKSLQFLVTDEVESLESTFHVFSVSDLFFT